MLALFHLQFWFHCMLLDYITQAKLLCWICCWGFCFGFCWARRKKINHRVCRRCRHFNLKTSQLMTVNINFEHDLSSHVQICQIKLQTKLYCLHPLRRRRRENDIKFTWSGESFFLSQKKRHRKMKTLILIMIFNTKSLRRRLSTQFFTSTMMFVFWEA